MLLLLPLLLAVGALLLAPAQSALAQELEIDKVIVDGERVVESGSNVTYAIYYTCASVDQDCLDAVIVDTLPPGLRYVESEKTPEIKEIRYNAATRRLELDFGAQLTAGTTGVVQITVQIEPGTPPGTALSNSVRFEAQGLTTVTSTSRPVTTTGDFEMFPQKRVVSNPIVQGEPIEFALEVCSPDVVGGVRLVNAQMVDTLPFGAELVSAQGVEGVDWTYNPITRKLTFLTVDNPVPVGGCTTRTMSLRYPVGTEPITGQQNQLRVTGTPEGCTNPLNLPARCDGQTNITLDTTTPFTVVVPFPDFAVTKSAQAASSYQGIEALPGEAVTYTISAENTGYLTLTNAIVTDTIPAKYKLDSFTVSPNGPTPVSGFYRTSAAPTTWVALAGNPYTPTTTINVAGLGLGAGVVITELRWELGPLPKGAPVWSSTLKGSVVESALAGDTIVNTADGSALRESELLTSTQDATVKVLDKRSIPRAYKTSGATGDVLPGETVTFTVRVKNEDVAHLNMVNPMMADLLPIEFDYVPTSFKLVSKPDGAPDPVWLIQGNYDGTGRTLLRAAWTGASAYNLAPGSEFVLTYAVKVKDGITPRVVTNKAIIASLDNPEVAIPCADGDKVADINDIDGDGNRTEIICVTPGSGATTEIGVIRSLSSQKLVKGTFDTEWGSFGHTAPGSTADYKLVITNTSNVSISNIIIVDILPAPFDTGVVDPTQRKSDWRPNLVGPVEVPPGLPLTIFYSSANNPCRPELVASGPALCSNDWNQEFPRNMITGQEDPTLVKAIKFDFCDYIGDVKTNNCLTLDMNEVQELTWPMRSPVDAPVSADCTLPNPVGTACKIAWNSFGVTATGGGFQFRPTEPKKVGIGVQESQLYSVGDLVWIDIAGIQADGIQQEGEVGLNGVRVEIWNATTNALVDYTLTADDFNDEPGFYNFAELPAGDYFIRFFPPDVTEVSPADQGGDDTRDSDGVTPGSSVNGNYVQTANFTLGPGTSPDMTRDLGLWRVSDYGDAPYNNGAFKYPTSSTALQAAGQSPNDAARHIIGLGRSTAYFMGAQRDAELDGVPTTTANGDDSALGSVLWDSQADDEDGVTLPQLVPSADGLGNSGVFVRGTASPVPVTVTAPAGKTGYLNAWIDWNGNGQWEASEQIANGVAQGGAGTITLNVTPPAGAVLGTTYARFRFSPERTLSWTGMVFEGEVEDYRVQIIEAPAKTLVSTSEVATSNTNVTIGEIVRYQLKAAIPEGQVNDVVFTDILAPGLQFVELKSVATESNAAMTIENASPVVSGGPFGSGTDVVFTFGDVTNNDNDAGSEYITLELTALVLNEAGNQAGVVLSNEFKLTFTNFTATTPKVNVTVVEPAVDIVKTIETPLPKDAGDTLIYKLVATNPGGANSSPAFEVVISDTINANLTIDGPISISASAGVITADQSSGQLIKVSADRLDAGESVTVLITTKIANSIDAATTIPNWAGTTWTSLPGDKGTTPNDTGSSTPGNSGDPTGERNGNGGVNDYTDRDAEPIALTKPAILKQLVGKNTYTIGEEVRYDLLVTLPEGTIQDLVVRDLLPAGLLFSSATVYTADADSDLLTADFGGSLPAATPAVSGNTISWTFGDVVNTADNSAANDKFVIRLVTVVRNVIGNQAGVNLDNSGSLTYFNPTTNAPETINTAPVRISLVEPVLAITKSVAPTAGVDAGDEVIYTIVLQHAAGSVGTAYNVVLTDTLPLNLRDFSIDSIAATGITAPVGAISGSNVRVPATGTFDMPPGATVTLRVIAIVDEAAKPGVGIINRTGAIWTSLPDSPAEERTSGNSFPDGVDPLNGGGLNDYEVQTTATLTPANKDAVTKALTSTNAPHTTGANVTIGEIVTYTLSVNLGEGTIPSLEITDNVPAGLAYIGGSLKLISTGFGGTLPTPTVTPTADGTTGQDVVISFGQIVVTGDNVTTNNGFTMQLAMRVLDVAGNNGLSLPPTVLPNSATWRVGTNPTQTTPVVNVTVVEPKLSITKTIVPEKLAANDEFLVTLVAGNVGTSTAFSSTLNDTLPTGMLYVGSLTNSAGVAPATLTQTAGTISALWNKLEPGETSTITFMAKLASSVTAGQVITNKATFNNASTLPGTVPGERTEPGVESPDSITVIAPELGIVKDDLKTNIVGGELLKYTLTVTNYGERQATGVVISDTVPANTTFVAAESDAGWSCTSGGAAGGLCTLTLGTVDPGAANAKSVFFAVRVDTNIPRTVTQIYNASRVSDDGAHGPDPVPGNNREDDTDVHVSAALGNFVWEDTNGNGKQDAGEPVVPNVTVKLYAADGTTLLGTTTTNASGIYSFTNLYPADYIVEFTRPSGYKFTPIDQGADNAVDSDANQATGRTAAVTLPANTYNDTIDAGIYRPAAIGNFVWLDANIDGIQAGETGVDGATVKLYKAGTTTPLSTTTTSGGGFYSFIDLLPGDYFVEVTPPTGYNITPAQDSSSTTDALDSDISPTTGRTTTVNLESGETDNTWDGGLYQPASLGNFVWDDLDGDNRQDAGEPGIPGATVNLLGPDGTTVLKTTTTDASGVYTFSNLLPGDYIVQFVTPTGRTPVAADVGAGNPANDLIDSDANIDTGKTIVINLVNNEVDKTWDAGYYTRVNLGNFVWEDLNGNGLQDAGEPGVAGVTVNLYRFGNTAIARTTTTDANGFYQFTNLRPDEWEVEFVVTGDYTLTLPDVGADPDKDSDANVTTGRTGKITLVSGHNDMTWDAGIVNKVSMGDYVWLDTNGNGVQDGGEAGVAGVPVKLVNVDTGAVLTSATDSTGYYGFGNLQPGNYYVEFTQPTGYSFTQPLAAGNTATDSNVSVGGNRTPNFLLQSGKDDLTIDAGIYAPAIAIKKYTNGNDADTVPGPTISESSPVTWTYYVTNTGNVRLENLALVDNIEGAITCPVTTLDVGASTLCRKVGAALLGQYTNTGTVTATPPNRPAVVVSDDDPSHYNGVAREITLGATIGCVNDSARVNVQISGLNFTPSNPTPLTLTWKALDGTVVLTQPNLPLSSPNLLWPGTVLDGAGKVIDYPGWDQDASGDWYEVPTNLRPKLILVASVNPTQEVELTYPPSTPICTTAPRGYLGNYVWNDTNLNGRQDPGEAGVDGVTVQLFRTGEATPMATTTTAAGGLYKFPNLAPGSYEVVFQLPSGYSYTQAEQGDDVGDSDANVTTGRTPAYVLSEGGYTNDVDAGIYRPGLALRKYTNNVDADTPTGPQILINTPVTWTYFITNTGTVTLYSVTLTDSIEGIVTCPQEILAPGASMLCSKQGLAKLGQYANEGIVTGLLPGEKGRLEAKNPSHYVGYDTPPVIQVLKTPSTELLPWPGGPVTFNVVISNTSVNDIVELKTLTDTIYGNLNGQGTCVMPQTLALGAAYSCAFTKTLSIPPDNNGNLEEVNVVTGRGTGTGGVPVSDDDDAKVVVPCQNGGTVNGLAWHDANDNEIVDAGEMPFNLDTSVPANQRIKLYVALEENNPTRTVPERTVLVETTDGRFSFTGLKTNATYTLRVLDDVLMGMGFGPTTSSLRLNVDPLNCAPLEFNLGYVRIQGLVGDFLWYDVNRNSIADEWYDANGDGTVTANPGGGKLADFEFLDANGNGVVDLVGELNACGLNSTGVNAAGVSDGPRVRLWTGDPTRDRTMIIDNTGYYRFTHDAKGDPLSATGTYTVTRDPYDSKQEESAQWYAANGRCRPITTAANMGIVQVVQSTSAGVASASAAAAASDWNFVQPAGVGPYACDTTTVNGSSTNLTNKPDHTDLTLDFAVVCVNAAQTAGLGNRVWIDLDKDGLQDAGEAGIAGVVVNLYVAGDLSSPIRTFTTGADGAYTFTNLIPMQYVVEFVLPSGRVFTLNNSGGDDAIDSDADTTTGRTSTISLAPGQYDDRWDAGVLGVPTTDEPSEEPNGWVFLPLVHR